MLITDAKSKIIRIVYACFKKGYHMKLRPVIKYWLETDEGYVFGEGAFKILSAIQKMGTLSDAAKALGMSYRHAWGIVKTVEKRIGRPVLKTYKGGQLGGGGAKLTEEGLQLLEKYLAVKKALTEIFQELEKNDG